MIKNVTINECTVVVELAQKLWPYHNLKQLQEEFSRILTLDNFVVFVYYNDKSGKAEAFAQCEIKHDYVEGTETATIGYLNGIFVDKVSRNKGLAKELLDECENWAKNKGCTEFVSDCESDNESLSFYQKSGFKETNRTIHFVKKIK